MLSKVRSVIRARVRGFGGAAMRRALGEAAMRRALGAPRALGTAAAPPALGALGALGALPALASVGLAAGLVAGQAGCLDAQTFTPEAPSVPAPRLPMNNAYQGSIFAGPLRPRFAWEPSTATAKGEIGYQLQFTTDPAFERDVTTIETAETSYQPDGNLPVSLAPPVGARYFWRLRACLRTSCSEYSRPWYVNLGRVVKDYNGDGYSDVAVGAPGSDSYTQRGGRVFVYFGGPGRTVDGMADVLIGGPIELSIGRFVGSTIQSAGDVNGDGFSDLILSTPIGINFHVGAVFVYLGGTGASLDGVFDTRFYSGLENDGFGREAAAVGDVNGDGFDDLSIITRDAYVTGGGDYQAGIFLGSSGKRLNAASDGSITWRNSEGVVAAAGDVNGDGFGDVIVGNGFDDTGGASAGAAYVFEGAPGDSFDGKMDAILIGHGSFDVFGAGVASAGDINADGFSDIAIGSPRGPDTGAGESGSVYIFFGGPGPFDIQADGTVRGTSGNDAFGSTLCSAGDVNADGYADLLVGASLSGSTGKAYLYLGGVGSTFEETPDATMVGPEASYFAEKISTAGDVNGDGFSDIAVGAPGYAGDKGRVDIYLGAPGNTFDNVADTTLLGAAASDSFGAGLASLHVSPIGERRFARHVVSAMRLQTRFHQRGLRRRLR